MVGRVKRSPKVSRRAPPTPSIVDLASALGLPLGVAQKGSPLANSRLSPDFIPLPAREV